MTRAINSALYGFILIAYSDLIFPFEMERELEGDFYESIRYGEMGRLWIGMYLRIMRACAYM